MNLSWLIWLLHAFVICSHTSLCAPSSFSDSKNCSPSAEVINIASSSRDAIVDEILSRTVTSRPQRYDTVDDFLIKTSGQYGPTVSSVLEDADFRIEDTSSEEGTDGEFGYMATTKSSRKNKAENDRNKSLFRKAWRNERLSCNMQAQVLALGVSKIKVNLLGVNIDRSIGKFASNHIQRYRDKNFQNDYRLWIRKYDDCLTKQDMKLKQKETLMDLDLPLEERKRLLLDKIVKFQPRSYDDWKRFGNSAQKNEIDTLTRAKKAGEKILSIARQQKGDPNLEMRDLSIAEIEYYSRELDEDGVGAARGEEKVTQESIRKYLKKYLHKDTKIINEFSSLRLNYKLQQQGEKQKAKKRMT